MPTTRLYDKAVIAAQTTRPMNLLAGVIKAQLVDLGAYTPDFAADEFLSAIPVGARLGAPITLTGKSVVGRVFDAADVASHDLGGALSASAEALVIYEEGASAAASPLLFFTDVDANGAISVPTGTTAISSLAWSSGANKIFKL